MTEDQWRIHKGFKQVKFAGQNVWKFIIYGFCWDNEHAYAATETGETLVPIDDENRITINGRKYSEDHWYH